MIQALKNQTIEPKASVKAKGQVAQEAAVDEAETKLEGMDFANELMASLSVEEQKVAAKKGEASGTTNPEAAQLASLQQLLSTEVIDPEILGPEAVNPDIVSPQAFDPALTEGVGEIIQPKTTQIPAEIIKDVDADIAHALFKTPQVQNGRSPAIDLVQTEIDPQLMNMDDFVAQKNMAIKKSVNNTSAYGMPAKAQSNKAGMESGLKSTQTINELGATPSDGNASSMSSQQFILNSQIDMNSNAKVNEAQALVKTFDMSNIKTDNPNQIMTQITDYIVQAKAAKEPTVNMRVNHEELGMIDITVQKTGLTQEAIAINIGTHSVDGKNFFQANSKDLFSHLTNSGLSISDLKVETPTQTAKNDFDFGSQSGRGSFGQDKQFGSEQNQKRHDSERRQDLWNLLKDKEAA